MGHSSVYFIPDQNLLKNKIIEIIKQNDLILTMGAGNIWNTAHDLVKNLQGSQ